MPRVRLEHKEPQELKEQRVLRVLLEPKVLLVLRVLLV